MVELKWYIGKVVDNDDSSCDDKQQLGRVKIRVHPEMAETTDDLLPWMRPWDVLNQQLAVPLVGDWVWCISTDEYAKSWFYGGVLPIDDDLDIPATMKKIREVAPKAKYPSTQFWRSADGAIFFVDQFNRCYGTLHPSGAKIITTTDGDVFIRGNQKASLTGGSTNLCNVLTTLATAIADLASPANYIGGAPFAPDIYTKAGETISSMNVLKSDVKAFKE
jgi:hypothetical protein